MADQMNPQGMQGALDRMKAQRSVLNPVDAASMAQDGTVKPGMTVRQVLEQFGIDVDGPAEQLSKFAQSQMQNRTMMGKMGMPPTAPQAAGGMPGRKPMVAPPGAPGVAGVQGGGIQELLKSVKG